MEEEAADPPQQPTEAVKISSPDQTSSEMEEEAVKKGYGKAYAAFGGGREGLEACAASRPSLLALCSSGCAVSCTSAILCLANSKVCSCRQASHSNSFVLPIGTFAHEFAVQLESSVCISHMPAADS